MHDTHGDCDGPGLDYFHVLRISKYGLLLVYLRSWIMITVHRKFLFWVRVTLKEEGHVIQTSLLKQDFSPQSFKDQNEEK